MTIKDEALVERIAALESSVSSFHSQQSTVNDRLLRALEGNGTPGIKDRVTKLEYGGVDVGRAITELTRTIVDLTQSTKVGRATEEASMTMLIETVKCLDLKFSEHIKPGNLEHETLAKAFRTKPVRTLLVSLLALAVFTLGAVSRYFEHIVSALKGIP